MRTRWVAKQDMIIQMADYMIENNATCEDIEEELGIPHSTAWWLIQKRLPYIDYGRSELCKAILFYHKYHKKRRKKNGRTA